VIVHALPSGLRPLPADGRTPRAVSANSAAVVPLASMTSRQLIRRAKIIEAVTDLIGEVGPEAVQMREVAQRSGVALATAYRYFRSKEQLLGAALQDWQERLTRRTLSASRSSQPDPLTGVLDYLRRAQRAFGRNPKMTALMLQMMTSTDPDIGTTLDRMNQTNTEMFDLLLQGFPTEEVPNLSFALNSILTSAINGVLMGRMSLEESETRVEWTARALLGHAEAGKN
jgi:AcrR family transcriptional regulator